MEDKIIEVLGNIVNRPVSHDMKRVVVIDFDLKVSVEQFRKFQEWLVSQGFIEVKYKGDDILSLLFMELDRRINSFDDTDMKERQILYRHIKDKKTVYITYTIGDEVTIEQIIYFEKV